MKKSNMDLIVGGSILLSLFLLIASVLWLKEVNVTRELVEYAVLFPDISTLQVGDPVKANGVKVGNVAKMRLRGDRVAVIMKVDKALALTDSCMIVVQNIGLMGERMVGIRLSEKGQRYSPIAKNSRDTSYIKGYFDTGIAEAMGLMGNVLVRAEILVKSIESIIDSTVGDPRFSSSFSAIVERLDTVTRLANALVVGNRARVDRAIGDMAVLASDVRSLVQENQQQVSSIIGNGAVIAHRAVSLIDEVDSIAVSIKTLLGDVERSNGTLRMLIEDEQLYRDIKKSLSDLDTLVREVKEDGLKLQVRVGFRKNTRKK